MNNNELKPGTVVVAGYYYRTSVIVPLANQPPGSIAVYTPERGIITVYCKPECREITLHPDPKPGIESIREEARYAREQATRMLAIADKIEAGEPVTEFPLGVDIRYVDYEAPPAPKNRVSFAPVD